MLLSLEMTPPAAVSLYSAWYNFCRVHQTLRITPVMEAGVTNHIWTVEELLAFC